MRLINHKDQRSIAQGQNADTISIWLLVVIVAVAAAFAWWLY